VNLCKAGGSKPFCELVAEANLESPFEKATVESVVSYAKKYLNENPVE